MAQKGKQLKQLMEEIEEGYAYQVMALEMQLDEKGNDHNKIQSISRLLQLYMMGVEILESKGDLRYKYFNLKIQNLMKKPLILQQMYRASTTTTSQTPQEIKKAQLGQRKQDYRVQMFLSHELVNEKKVKQILNTAQDKLKRLQSRVQGSMISQDNELNERIKRRKMRSDAGSIEKFKVTKGKVIESNFINQKTQDYFEPWDIKPRMKGSQIIDNQENKRNN